jgi:hypothetical protein
MAAHVYSERQEAGYLGILGGVMNRPFLSGKKGIERKQKIREILSTKTKNPEVSKDKSDFIEKEYRKLE